MLNKIKELNNMRNKAKKIEAGLYEYRGFVIENMQLRAECPWANWSFGQKDNGCVYSTEYHDTTNSLAEAKEFIDRVYFGECA